MKNITQEDQIWVLQNFDDEGELRDPTDEQWETLKTFIQKGRVKQKWNPHEQKNVYTALHPIDKLLYSRKWSKIMEGDVVACTNFNLYSIKKIS